MNIAPDLPPVTGDADALASVLVNLRDQILNAVWGRDILVTARSVDRCVTTLRSKIEPDPGRPALIQTILDIGYRFDDLDR